MLENFKKTLIDACIYMAEKKLTLGTWGNISLRDPETGNIYLTPSGMDYYGCVTDDIIVYDKDLNLVCGNRRPSIEKDMHLMIMQNRKDVNVVIHTHPFYSTVFAVTEQTIPAVTEEFAQLIGNDVICAKYALPGTMELAGNALKALGDRNAVLLTSHGALCVGSNVQSAFIICEVLEKAAQVLIYSKLIGTARIIPEEEVKIMQNFVKTAYGQIES